MEKKLLKLFKYRIYPYFKSFPGWITASSGEGAYIVQYGYSSTVNQVKYVEPEVSGPSKSCKIFSNDIALARTWAACRTSDGYSS